jgi:hypothetical protein
LSIVLVIFVAITIFDAEFDYKIKVDDNGFVAQQ